jgi:hypothetical protein
VKYGNWGWVNYYFREGKVADNWGGIDRGVMAKYKYLGEEQMHGILFSEKNSIIPSEINIQIGNTKIFANINLN